MSNTETDSINEKKNDSKTKDYKEFFKNYMSAILNTIVFSIFIIGTIGLYTTKVAQANILPDDANLAPYTIFDRIIENDIPIDTNIMRSYFWSKNKVTLSQKIVFNSQEYLDSFNNGIFCKIKEKAIPGNLFSNIPLYFSPVYDNLVASIFSAMNFIFFYLSFLPESVIMLVCGLGYAFIWGIILVYAICCSVYYHIANIPQLFREKFEHPGLDTAPTDNPDIVSIKILDEEKWESNKNISLMRIWKIVLFFISFYPIMFSIFLSPIIFTVYGFLSPLYATYKINKTDKTQNFYDFVKNTLKFKKLFFYILATGALFTNGIQYLGTSSLVPIAIAVVCAYLIGLYTNVIPEAGIDGFTARIRETPIQSTVNKLDVLKQVDTCIIPTMDDKINNIIIDPNVSLRKIKPVEVELTPNKSVSFDSQVKYIPPIENPPSDNVVEEKELVGGKSTKRKINKNYNIKFV
jgi:hypothetical protein